MNPKLRPLVFAGPSGVGKSTLLGMIRKDFPNKSGFSISHTTRSIRPGETDGVNYHFVTPEAFEQLKQEDGFIETAIYSGNFYGTSKKSVHDVQDAGKLCTLDIDIQGVLSLKKTSLNPYFVFVSPPSFEVLEERLRKRSDTSEEAMQLRLQTAREELKYADREGFWDLKLVNDDLEATYAKLKAWVLERYPDLN